MNMKQRNVTTINYSVVIFQEVELLKGPLSGLRQFLASESPLKLIKNAFYFTSKFIFVLKIVKFLSGLFGHVSKRLD